MAILNVNGKPGRMACDYHKQVGEYDNAKPEKRTFIKELRKSNRLKFLNTFYGQIIAMWLELNGWN